jgi:hypothetical protein
MQLLRSLSFSTQDLPTTLDSEPMRCISMQVIGADIYEESLIKYAQDQMIKVEVDKSQPIQEIRDHEMASKKAAPRLVKPSYTIRSGTGRTEGPICHGGLRHKNRRTEDNHRGIPSTIARFF